MNDLKVYVIHVRGQREREIHIRKELNKFNIDFEFILDGNKEDITPKHLDKYFIDPFKEVGAVQSCSLKHIYAVEELIKSKNKYALIFEDDIILKSNFNAVLSQILQEIKQDNLSNFLVSLEKTNLAFVGKKEIVKGKTLYPRKIGRCAGAYLIDIEFAKNFMASIEKGKCHCCIDWYHNFLAENNQINIFWAHPYIAQQGSHDGSMPSLIDAKKTGLFRKIIYYFQGLIKFYFAKK